MTDTLSKHQRNLSALIHASTFSKFFIPFGNFIIPLVLSRDVRQYRDNDKDRRDPHVHY